MHAFQPGILMAIIKEFGALRGRKHVVVDDISGYEYQLRTDDIRQVSKRRNLEQALRVTVHDRTLTHMSVRNVQDRIVPAIRPDNLDRPTAKRPQPEDVCRIRS